MHLAMMIGPKYSLHFISERSWPKQYIKTLSEKGYDQQNNPTRNRTDTRTNKGTHYRST
jgi:hypothetical protein